MAYVCAPQRGAFRRVATHFACTDLDAQCDDDTTTASEIVAATADGSTLVYTDSPRGVIGFVDVTDPSNPAGDGTLDVAGEPTSVAVKGNWVVAAVVEPTSTFVAPTGKLVVVDASTRQIEHTIPLPGQPDSIAISPDGNYAAVVLENQRDEDLEVNGEEGALPQLPAGALLIVSLSDPEPGNWTTSTVDLAAALSNSALTEPSDPEPEFVDINADNQAVVTLQENNGIALVDLTTGEVTQAFTAGTVNLLNVDAQEESPAVVSQTEPLFGIPREPDGVAWIGTSYFATADEGDWLGGSRGFTIFNTSGDVVYTSGAELEHLAARFGHYPDARSENKGNEPENVEYVVLDGTPYLIVNSERSSLVFVFDVSDVRRPVFKQALPAALGPEGALAIASSGLLVVASEEDSREDGFRGGLNLYTWQSAAPNYPTIVSSDRADGTPIPFAALSGLAADDADTLYAIDDSYFGRSRIFTLDVASFPARLVKETWLRDSNDVLRDTPVVDVADDAAEDDASRVAVFDDVDLAALINEDKTVNLDPEGISLAAGGGFWIASEGAGTFDDTDNPVNSANLLVKVNVDGVIERVVRLPAELDAAQLRFGFEGVAEHAGLVYVAFQRRWSLDPANQVRIGIYDPASAEWRFVLYTLDAAVSPGGGWVGLSEITSLGNGHFLVVERDNMAGPDARIKRLYEVDLTSVDDGETVPKTLVRDVLVDLKALGGHVPEKIEGAAFDATTGKTWIVNDNDGVDDNSGETQLLDLGRLF